MLNLTYPQVWFTYGPQTKDDEVIRELIKAGATGARLTFSFGTPELQVERSKQLKRIAAEQNREFVAVADLQGEKCRFRKVDGVDEISLLENEEFALTAAETDLSGQTKMIGVQIPSYLDVLEPGDTILEGDGALMIRVLRKTAEGVYCVPMKPGKLHPGRGMIVQKREFRPVSMTEKDIADLQHIARSGAFDAVAISFISSANDVEIARQVLTKEGSSLPIIAKIETGAGVEHIEEIVKAADGIMIARGDLALAQPWVDLYANTLRIAETSKQMSRPWILATQLVEGLETFEFPTRAEICDLAHWVEFGANTVMLSYETAFGSRPIDAVAAVRAVFDRYADLKMTESGSSSDR